MMLLPDSGLSLPGGGDRSQQIGIAGVPDASSEVGQLRSLQRDQPGNRLATLGNHILRAGNGHFIKKGEATSLELSGWNLDVHDYDYSTMVINLVVRDLGALGIGPPGRNPSGHCVGGGTVGSTLSSGVVPSADGSSGTSMVPVMVLAMVDPQVAHIRIDGAGRMVIPRRMRERLGLDGPGEVEISERGDLLELRAAPTRMRLERSPGGVTVLRPEQELPPLTTEAVRAELDRIRHRR